jgi:hypothetical protein
MTLHIEELDSQSATVLPERAALGVVVVKIKAHNSANAWQAWTIKSTNGAVANQVIAVG